MHQKRNDSELQHKAFAFKADVVEEDGTFKGYGSVFGNVDSYGEIVAPGAFLDSLKTIAKSGDPLPALWQHRSGEPIGGYTLLEEDKRGLKVEGFLVLDDPVAKRAHLYMQKRVVKGLSIGYYVRDSSFDEKTGIRTLRKLDLVEISVVTFPANADAQVDSVKSARAAGKATVRQVEEFLRDAGFTKTVAAGMAGSYGAQVRRDSDSKNSQDVLAALRGINF